MGKAKGHYFYPGKPCHFMAAGNGCTIYDERPKPCRVFACRWLTDLTVPENLKPSISGLIVMPNPEPLALPVHGSEVSAQSWILYQEWADATPAE